VRSLGIDDHTKAHGETHHRSRLKWRYNVTKIAFIGAGSFVFARTLVSDVLTWPSLRDSTIALMDIDETKLEVMGALARRMVDQVVDD
jgi:alpha-galactosidase/6-phospho-beta-glucosidase family protein